MNARVRVAFVDRDPPSGFMEMDRRCLAEHFDVDHVVYPGRTTAAYVWRSLLAAEANDVVYAFFASEHALAPALAFKARRKRFLLVPAGYDYANVPERTYGLAARGRGWLPKLLGRLCDVALPISRQSEQEFLALVPSAVGRTHVGYLGVDAAQWEDPGVERNPERVVTVGYIDAEAWSRKGIDRFVAAAARNPARQYTLAGRLAPEVEARVARDLPANLEVTGYLDHDDLRTLLWSCGVYAQLSWHETFGMAMAEAMLCGCVPLITPVPALAEVAGEWAVVVREGEDDVAAVARAAGAGADEVRRAAMRAEIAERFSPARRTEILRTAVEQALR